MAECLGDGLQTHLAWLKSKWELQMICNIRLSGPDVNGQRILYPCSTMAVQTAVNGQVVGSSPAVGANFEESSVGGCTSDQ